MTLLALERSFQQTVTPAVTLGNLDLKDKMMINVEHNMSIYFKVQTQDLAVNKASSEPQTQKLISLVYAAFDPTYRHCIWCPAG